MLGMNKQFGVREIANVVLKAKADMEIGTTKFKAGEPVLYFDTLKTSTVEGAATTVYATGGRGNARLVSWDGERTITFTMEDALISPMGLAILAGAGLVKQPTGVAHFTERLTVDANGAVGLTYNPAKVTATTGDSWAHPVYFAKVDDDGSLPDTLAKATYAEATKDDDTGKYKLTLTDSASTENAVSLTQGDVVFVDYYATTDILNIDIEPGKFSGNFYLEAATLFRDTDGKDHAAEFIIPNCRVQSNFTFTMAATGDPSTFTFTMDAFPGYTVYDKTKKVLCAIQVLGDGGNAQGE